MSEATTIDGYELKNCIATGNTTQVWEVMPSGGSSPVAMKLILAEKIGDPDNIKVLKHEAKIGKMMEHPNIVRCHDLVVNKKRAYLIMDFFKAPNLKHQIRGDVNQVKLRIRKLIESLCGAMGHIHGKGWVHRDIKPENILFTRGSELRLIDFSLSTKAASGFAKLVGSKLKVIQGTRTYLAPETIQKKQPTPQTDIYSLGVTIFESITGNPPFRSGSPNELLKKHLVEAPPPLCEIDPNITPEMEKFVNRLLAKKPANRPGDMNEVLAEFRSVKVFHEEIEAVIEREKNRSPEELEDLSTRLDSRTDAKRKELGLPPKEIKKKKKEIPKKLLEKLQPKQPQHQPGQMPPGQMPPGQPMPGYYPMQPPAAQYPPMPPQVPFYPPQPGMPPQQFPPPGYPQPPQGMPQQMPPGQMPPQHMPPGQMPPQQMPPGQQPPPGQGMPQQAPPPMQGQPQQPGQPQQAPVKGPGVAPGEVQEELHPSQSNDDDNLEFMDELPDVI